MSYILPVVQVLLGAAWVGKGLVHLGAGTDSGYWGDDFALGGAVLALGVVSLVLVRRHRARVADGR